MGDQALSSLTNFGVGVALARSLPTADFGAFGIGFSLYLLILSVSRSIATEPLVIRYSSGDDQHWREGVRGATATSFTVGVAASLLSIGIWTFTTGPLSMTFLGLAFCFPGLMLQDSWRFAFFAAGSGRSAFLNDLVWAATMAPLLIFLMVSDRASVLTAVLAWGGSATVAGIVGMWQSSTRPDLRALSRWMSQHRDLTPRFVAEELTVSAGNQMKLVTIGAVASLVAAGAYRGAEVLLGPVRVIQMGVRLIAIPEAVRLLDRSITRFVTVIARVSALLGVSLLSVGLIVYRFPDAWGTALLGDTWPLAQPVVLPMAIAAAATGTFLGPVIGLRALEAAKESLRARMAFSGSTLLAATLGAAAAGALGAAWSVASVSILGSVLWWAVFFGAVRSRKRQIREERNSQ